ncbi:MAG TPA: hypothetical protein VHR88_08425 [Solirubrobacteraceae bacterium]|nr:hypothetical protein [Solirubrobacteraceae bacterium]
MIVTSRGNPATQNGRQEQQQNVNNAVRGLVDQLEALGGTRTDAFQALSPGVANSGASYQLLGWSGAGTAHGVESQGQGATPARGLNSAALEGSFRRGGGYQFDVGDSAPSNGTATGPVHQAGQKLDDALVQPPTAWPDANNPGQQGAIAYIGKQTFAGDDIRTDYWKSGHDDTWWSQKKNDVGGVSYPGGGSTTFTAADLAAAKTEIQQEITWLLAVRDFTRGLAAPFARGQLQSWADLTAIAADVNNDVQAPAQNKALAIATAIFEGARNAATAIPVIGEGISIVNDVYDTALEISRIGSEGDESADEPFQVTAGKVGSELVTRLTTAQNTLTTQMTNAVVADYGKLKAVGSCDLLDTANCPDDPQEWKFDGPDQLSASKALRVGAQVEDYAALTPARWTLWQLGDSCAGSTNFTCWETDFQGDGFRAGIYTGFHVCPFLTEPRSTKLIRPVYRDIPAYRNNAGFNSGAPTDVWQTYALGNLGGNGVLGTPYTMELPKDFLARVFKPLDPGGNIDLGGLGAQPEQFFLGNFTPKLMARPGSGQPYPYRDSTPAWDGRDVNCLHD